MEILNNYLNELKRLDEIDNEQDETTYKILQLHATAKQYQDELNKIHDNINKLSNYKLKCINYCNCVNYWTI